MLLHPADQHHVRHVTHQDPTHSPVGHLFGSLQDWNLEDFGAVGSYAVGMIWTLWDDGQSSGQARWFGMDIVVVQ